MKATLTPTEIGKLDKLEAVIEKGQKTFVEVGIALTEIKNEKLYRRDFDTFEAYCQQRWGWTRIRAYQLIEAAEVVSQLPENVKNILQNPGQAAEVARAPKEQREEIVKAAAENGPVTAKSIAAERDKRSGPPPFIPQPAPPPQPKDEMGYPIPTKIVPGWQEAQGIQTLLNAISSTRSAVRNAEDDKDRLWVEVNFSSAKAHANQLYEDLKCVKPHVVCTTCQGRASEQCRFCGGRGFISKFRWDTMVPIEVKKLREKAIEAL